MARLNAFAAFSLICLWVSPFAPGPAPWLVPIIVCWVLASGGFFLVTFEPRVVLGNFVSGIWLNAALLSCIVGLIQFSGNSDQFSHWMNTTQPGEAFANLRQRNQFASLTNIGLVSLFYLSRAQAKSSRWTGILALAAAGLLGLGNAASSSRTGLLQVIVLTSILAFWRPWRLPTVWRLLLATWVAYAVAMAALPLLIGHEFGDGAILGRFNEQTVACQSRLVLWDNVMTLIAQKPWLGWGWGELDYAHFVTLYPGGPEARFCDILDNAHNLPLHLAVELGVPFAAVVCLTLAGAVAWLKPWLDQDPVRQLAWGVLLVIGLHSLLEYPLWYGPFQIAVILCVLLLWQSHRTRRVDTSECGFSAILTNGGISRFVVDAGYASDSAPEAAPTMSKSGNIVYSLVRVSAIFVLAFCGYALWDYHRISQIYLVPSERSAAYRYNTLEKIKGSWLFQNQVQFAELTTTDVTPENAAYVYAQAQRLLHFSPEARVAEKLIDSATLLNRTDEVGFFKLRYQAAFPKEFAQWQASRPTR